MSSEIRTRFVHNVVLEVSDNRYLPQKSTKGSSGYDLRAALHGPLDIAPGERKLIDAGFRMSMPSRLEAQIRPRSGMVLKYGLTVANAPGTIDSDYKGQVKVVLINIGDKTQHINPGDRIAQMVFAEVPATFVSIGDVDDDTERGEGGFGSTGVN